MIAWNWRRKCRQHCRPKPGQTAHQHQVVTRLLMLMYVLARLHVSVTRTLSVNPGKQGGKPLYIFCHIPVLT
jgi:hypothetical protein